MDRSATRFFHFAGLAVWILLAVSFVNCEGCLDDSTGGGSGGGSGNDSIYSDNAICGDPVQILGWPTSGFYLEYNDSHEIFHVWVNSEAGITFLTQWLTNPAPEALGTPGGPIEIDGDYNPGYNYRIDPTQATFASEWPESCDAAPCYVQDTYFSWIKSPTTWCPLAAKVVTIWNCDSGSGSSCVQVYPTQE